MGIRCVGTPFRWLVLVVLSLGWCGAVADAPRTFTYQARISPVVPDVGGVIGGTGSGTSSGSGNPTALTYTLRFTLYLDPEGYLPAGWTETHAGVPAPAGVVTVELGAMNPFPAGVFGQPLYLGVAVDSDPELTPRTALTNTPYGIQSAEALGQHQADPSAHHAKTTSFTELTDTVGLAQLPADVAWGSEVAAALATKADINHTHDLATLAPEQIQPLLDAIAALQARVEALETQVSGLQGQLDAAEGGVATAAALLDVVEISGTDVYFKGVNLHVNNGTGQADLVNGLGNLIVGYNLPRGDGSDWRSGSHNLVVGDQHNFSSYGGLVAGLHNGLFAPYASVLGGELNTVTAAKGVVVGGRLNNASGDYGSVLGGEGNTASGPASSVAGGSLNTASGTYASVAGGSENTAAGSAASVSGGAGVSVEADQGQGPTGDLTFGGAVSREGDTIVFNGVNLQVRNGSGQQTAANGLGNLIVGYNPPGVSSLRSGSHNLVMGLENSYTATGGVISGARNAATAANASLLGGEGNFASKTGAVVVAGTENLADADNSAVVGGNANSAKGAWGVVAGGQHNHAQAAMALVAGGVQNTADGPQGAVLGGTENFATGQYATVAGGRGSRASASYSLAAGGQDHKAQQPYASVLGGYGNSADASWAVAIGGEGNSVSGLYATVIGGTGNSGDQRHGFYAPLTPTLDALLNGLERVGDTLVFSGMNVQIVNGLGSTDLTNGLGNLILGYNADEAPANARTGSHNLVVGDQHSFSAHSGIVAGQGNAIAGAGASVLAGNLNIASGPFAAVLGGYHNSATNYRGVVVGGSENNASGGNAAVLGGALNTASGDESAVAGGNRNTASGRYATVGGGLRNSAGQQFSSIATGRNFQSQGAEQ